MKDKKIISMLLGCAMCGCVTTGLVVSAKADVGTETETATITIGLNGGFRVDASGTSAAYSEEDIVYETLTGGLTLTHEKVREIFENQPAFQKAVGGIDYNVACPGGAEVGSYPETDANGYYNYTSVTNGIFSPVLFGLFEDKDEDGEVDEGERLYLSGDTIDVRGDVKLACYYNESLIYGYVNSTQTTLWKGWTAEGAEANACKYDPVTQPNGWRTEYTARDLQPLYFELSKIGAQAFSLDGGWGVAAVERIEFPETVKELDAFGMKQLGMLEEINLNNIEYIYDYGFQQCGNAVQGEKRYVFEKIRGISQQALYNTTNGNSTYRYIFAGTGLADTDVNKLLSYHNANGTQLTLIFGNFGNEQDKSAELKNPTSYVYVPYGKTELYYADETAYASGQTNFSVAKEGETIIRANMPVREMYTVSFDVNGGEIEGRNEIENTYMDARAVSVIRGGAEANLGDGTERTNNPAGQTLTLLKAERPEAPERAGFAFRGWQDQYGNMWTEADWEAGGKAGVDYGAEGAKLTAQWGKEVLLTWVYNNGQPDSVPVTVAEGALLAQPETNPTPQQHYTFSGWYKDAECTQPWNFETDVVPGEDFCIYAGYEAQTMNVRLNVDGGTLTTSESIVESGEDYTLSYKYDEGVSSLPIPVKDGYTFEGWYDEEDNPVTAIAAETFISVLTAKYTKDVVVSTITYQLDGGTLEGGKTSDEYNEGERFVLPVPEKDGYTFDGWYRLANFTGNAVTEISASETGDIVLYAKWAENTSDSSDADDSSDSAVSDSDTDSDSVSSDSDSDGSFDSTGSSDEGGGCGSTIVAGTAILAFALIGARAVLKRGRKE